MMNKLFIILGLFISFVCTAQSYVRHNGQFEVHNGDKVRNSSGTVDEEVTNMISNGTFDSGTYWDLTGAVTISAGGANVTLAGGANIGQSDVNMVTSLLPSTAYTLQFDITIVSGNAYISIANFAENITYVVYDSYPNGTNSKQFTTPEDLYGGGIIIHSNEISSDNPYIVDNVVLTAD